MYRFHVTFRSPKDPGGLSDYPSYLRHLRGNEANVVPSGGTDLRENTKEIDHATDQKATDRVLSLENRRLVSGCCRHTGRVKRRAEVTSSGFLPDYSLLQPDPVADGARRWSVPNEKLRQYTQFMIDPVIVHFAPNVKGTAIDSIGYT